MIYLTSNKTILDGMDAAALAGGLIDIILYALIGFALAMIIAYYSKIIAGKGVRLLLENEAFSPETAKSLEELGIVKNVKYHQARLQKSVPQSRICVCIGEDTKRYYIPEENIVRAQRTYSVKEKPLGMTIMAVIITAVVFGAVYFTKDLIVERVEILANTISSSESGGQKTEDGFEYYPDRDETEKDNENLQDEGPAANEEGTEDENSDMEDENEQS